MGKYRDFDKFYSEHKEEPLFFKLFGEKYKLPASMPAKLMIEILRGQKEDDLEATAILEISESLFGKAQLDDLTKRGLTVEQMEDIIEWAAEEYGSKTKEKNSVNFPKQK